MSRTERSALKIPKDLRHALTLYRVRQGTAGTKATVPHESVEEVERGLGVSLPPSLLAVFAATGRDPYEMMVLTEELRDLYELPVTLVAVTEQPSRGPASRAPVYWCLDASETADPGRQMVWWSVYPNQRRHGLSILEFFQARYLEGAATPEESTAVQGLSSRFRPAVISQPRPAVRRIVHHRFGPGFVLREFNDGNHKVEVDFPSVGIKLLLASYVHDAPEPGNRPSRAEAVDAAQQRTA